MNDAVGGQTEDENAVAERLRTSIRRFGGSEPFTALGLDRRADETALKARYAELVGKFHPHHFARHSADTVALATEAFVQIQRARKRCQELLDSRKVSQPVNEARSLAGAQDPTRLAISETKRLLELSQFGAAADVLERALREDPDNTRLTVWRFLVDARQRKSRDDLTGALAVYEDILELAPGNREAIEGAEMLRAKLDTGQGLLSRLLGRQKRK